MSSFLIINLSAVAVFGTAPPKTREILPQRQPCHTLIQVFGKTYLLQISLVVASLFCYFFLCVLTHVLSI
jgi:hypothetical protein